MPYPAGDAAREEIDFFKYDDDNGESGEESNESGFVQEDPDEGGALAVSILQDEHASVEELREVCDQRLFAHYLVISRHCKRCSSESRRCDNPREL